MVEVPESNLDDFITTTDLSELEGVKKNTVLKTKERNPLIVWQKFIDEESGKELVRVSKSSWHVYRRTKDRLNQNIPKDCIPFSVLADLGEEFFYSKKKLLKLAEQIAPWDDLPIIEPQIYRSQKNGSDEPIYFLDVENVERIVKYKQLTKSFFSKKEKENRTWQMMPLHYSYKFKLKVDMDTSRSIQYIRFCKEVMPHTLTNLLYNGFVYTHNNLWDLVRDQIPKGSELTLALLAQYPDHALDIYKHYQRHNFDLMEFFFED
jgi:hypothetical protein